jgi:hypothetical protein
MIEKQTGSTAEQWKSSPPSFVVVIMGLVTTNQPKKKRKGIALESLNGTSTRGIVEGLCGRVGSEDPVFYYNLI